MPLQSLPLSQPNSPISLSSWPLVKYSYSISSISSPIQQPPWTHFPHRDNIFLVIDTQRVPGHIQNDGKFIDQQTRLKIVWGLETLEGLDLTSLTQQITPAHDFQQLNKPAFIALGRSPSLAIKYYKAEDQTIRRFQIKFLSSTAYQLVSALLERANCPVGAPPISRDDTKYEPSSQVQLCPLIPLIQNIQVLRTPPSTSSGYLPGSSSSSSSATLSGESRPLRNPPTYTSNTSPTYAHGFTAPASTTTSATSRSLYQLDDTQPVHQNPHLSHPYLPNEAIPPGLSLEEDIPPPRPPPNFGPRIHTKPSSVPSSKRSMTNLISSLPSLPKPTPLGKVPSMAFSDRDSTTYRASSFDSSPRAGFGVDISQQGNKTLAKKERVGTYRPGLPEIAEEYTKEKNSNDRGPFPVFPHGYKKPEPESYSYTQDIHNGRRRTDVDVSMVDARETGTGGKRKQEGDDDKEEQGQPKKQRGEDPNAHKEEEFRQIEDFIVNAIHDDNFLKLVERIGGVWQRMGFDHVGQSFFGGGVPGE